MRVVSEETCRKISESHRNKYNGKNNPFYGKKHSEDTKYKISKANIGRPGYWLGKQFSEETCRKLSEMRKGKYVGSSSHNWNPDITDDERCNKRNYPAYKEWSKQVKSKNNYTCQKCGKMGNRLHSHHIESYATNKELRIDINNGVTFCKKCHKRFHSLYGIKNNSRSQLEEFLCNN